MYGMDGRNTYNLSKAATVPDDFLSMRDDGMLDGGDRHWAHLWLYHFVCFFEVLGLKSEPRNGL